MQHMNKPKTLFNKIWDRHVVAQQPDSPTVLYIDLHLIHEVTSPQAFTDLRQHGLKVRRPDRTVATIDHGVPTQSPDSSAGRLAFADEMCTKQIHQLEENCHEFGVRLYDLQNANNGIVHIISPELGLTQPGMTIVCGDSHTATHHDHLFQLDKRYIRQCLTIVAYDQPLVYFLHFTTVFGDIQNGHG